MPQQNLRILPLGGLGEIGMNCLVLEWKDEIILIDCGIQFPDASFAGVDLLAPDFSYFEGKFDNIRAVVVTHGHDDHIGAIPFLARETELDVYTTPFPRGLIEQKLTEHSDLHEVRFHELEARKKFTVGSFTFDPIRVQHSIIESLAFSIETPVGRLVHTGDFKHEAGPVGGEVVGFGSFEELGKQGVLLLLSDSTNAERAGHTISETDIARSFEGIFAKQSSRLIIALFASNIRRIENLLKLAHRMGKKVALAGRSMLFYTKLAHGQSSLDIPEDTLILLENTGHYPDDKVIVLATGSQAEPGSALVRVAQGEHKEMKLKPGDQVILSSRFIPGNERNITSMIDQLYRSGAEVMYESIHQIHVSGHGFQDELLLMLKATRPKYFIPIHGEYRHLKKHATLARLAGVSEPNIVVIEDGQCVEVNERSISLGEKLALQKIPIVGGEYLDGNPEVFQQRIALSKTGIVFAAFLRDRKTGDLIADPQLSAHGLLFRKGESPEEVFQEAIEHIDDIFHEHAENPDLTETLRLEIRRFFKTRVSHKPQVIPLVLDL